VLLALRAQARQGRPGLRVRPALLEQPARRGLLERERQVQLACRVQQVPRELLDRLARPVRLVRRARMD